MSRAEKFTARVAHVGHAPKRIALLGDKTQRPEPAQHVIEFPGGAVEVSRTSDGAYWAHIIVHRGQPIDDADGRVSARGEVVGARLDAEPGVLDVPHADTLTQVAVLIRPAARGAEARP